MPSNRKENWLDTYRGVVHIGAPGGEGEHTVCGLAFDEPSSEHGGDAMQETALRPTCPDCIADGRILLEILQRQLRRVSRKEEPHA